tara:strand:+ start:1428 stop:1832 length:405 start_codon:yes stop_codon:yes gene_type:complete
MIISLFLTVISYDIWFYFMHRLFHTKLLYKYHKKHHEYVISKREAATYGTLVDNGLTSCGGIIVFLILPINIYGCIIGNIYVYLRGFVLHCPILLNNYYLKKIYTDHHLKHHLYFNCNYGQEWLDSLFGTSYKT